MRKARQIRRGGHGEEGYALLIVLFFVALLVLTAATAAPNVITNVRRTQEEEMIWRGKQYVRGIRMYYMKQHKFPNQLEDLYKPKTGMRFMRQKFKDPMNPTDGEWRLIYVGPNGMLIGSVKNRQVSLGGAAGSVGIPAAAAGNSAFGSSSNGSAFGSSSGFGSSGSAFGSNSNNGFGSQSSFGNNNSNSAFGSNNNSNNNAQNNATDNNGQTMVDDGSGNLVLQEPTFTDTSGIIGGNIIGVGSKINKKSIMVYDKAKNYRAFEFIWDPSKDTITGQTAGTIPANGSGGIGTPAGQLNSTFGNQGQGNSSFGQGNSSFGNQGQGMGGGTPYQPGQTPGWQQPTQQQQAPPQ